MYRLQTQSGFDIQNETWANQKMAYEKDNVTGMPLRTTVLAQPRISQTIIKQENYLVKACKQKRN